MGITQSAEVSCPFQRYPKDIQKSGFVDHLMIKGSEKQNPFVEYLSKDADEVFTLQRKADNESTKYVHKQELIQVINQLKQFQDDHRCASFKKDLDNYYEKVDRLDKVRKILDPLKESYLSERLNEQNQSIHSFVESKFNKFQKVAEKTDEWGFKYTISDSLCLTLPAQFLFDQETKIYKLKGKLTNQFKEFEFIQSLEQQISNLVTHFSESLKKTHECVKDARYENQLFSDTKQKVSFDKEIRAQVQIFEMEISPNQEYKGRFHKEGHSIEGILYSCLYVLEQDEGLDNGVIQFSRIFETREYDLPQFKSLYRSFNKYYPGKTGKQFENFSMPLGRSKLEEDLMIIFPNRNLHQVMIKNTSDQVQKRLVVQLSVVNHIDQPFTINNLEIDFKEQDDLNEIPYEIKKTNYRYLNTQQNISQHKRNLENALFVN